MRESLLMYRITMFMWGKYSVDTFITRSGDGDHEKMPKRLGRMDPGFQGNSPEISSLRGYTGVI